MTVIRHLKEKDIPAIAALGKRFLKEVPTWGLVIRTDDELRKLDPDLIWVVEENDKLVGHAICLPKKYDGQNVFSEEDTILELDEIYLVPEMRGQGIGSELLAVILDYAKKEGYTKSFVFSSVKDLMPVIKFYKNNGLKTWAVQFYKDLK